MSNAFDRSPADSISHLAQDLRKGSRYQATFDPSLHPKRSGDIAKPERPVINRSAPGLRELPVMRKGKRGRLTRSVEHFGRGVGKELRILRLIQAEVAIGRNVQTDRNTVNHAPGGIRSVG